MSLSHYCEWELIRPPDAEHCGGFEACGKPAVIKHDGKWYCDHCYDVKRSYDIAFETGGLAVPSNGAK